MNKVFIQIIAFFIFISVVSGQVNYKLNFESGYLYSDVENTPKSSELLTRFNLNLNYKTNGFTAKLVTQPGFLGVKLKPKALKLKGELLYLKQISSYNFGLGSSYQFHNYFEDDNFTLDIKSLTLFGSKLLTDNIDLIIRLCYCKQHTNFIDKQNINRLTLTINSNFYYNKYLIINYGFFYERFFIDSETNMLNGFRNENDGYRIGPALSFNYTKDFILRINYRYLYQNTKIFSRKSTEHKFRFVAGKLLNKFWSLFVLVDYTQPVYDFKLDEYNDKNLLYISTNYENNYYLKLARKLSENISVYTKMGYFNESIKYLGYDFKGWNCLLGVEIK